jgi:hypothetical protein
VVVPFDFTAAGAPLLAEPLPEAPFPPSAFNATASSTDDAAALASTPAALSLSNNSLLERPCSFAISCTRFLLIGLSILRAQDRSSPHNAMPARDRRVG